MTYGINEFPIRETKDFTKFFSVIKKLGNALQMSVLRLTQLLTAVSELLTNMLKYAGGGMVTVELMKPADYGIRMTCRDHGTGIADVELALAPGFSTGKTLGLGLPGAKRLTDEFTIRRNEPQGTIVTIAKFV